MIARIFFFAAGLQLLLTAGAIGQEKPALPLEGEWRMRLMTSAREEYNGVLTIRVANGSNATGSVVWRVPGEDLEELFFGTATEDSAIVFNSLHIDEGADKDEELADEYDSYYNEDDAGDYTATVAAGGKVMRKGSWLIDGAVGGYWSARWVRPLPKK